MRAGSLNRRLIIKAPSPATDAQGAPTGEYSTVGYAWGEVVPLTGREFVDAQARQAETITQIRIRYRGDLRSDMRLYDGLDVYEITAIQNYNGLNRETRLLCRKLEV